MSDCGVCIGDGDYGCDVSFVNTEARKARKDYLCLECRERITKGTVHEYVSGKSDGDFYVTRTCLSCAEIRDAFVCGEYLLGELWNDMRDQVFPELTVSNKCLQKLSAANRTRLVLKWQQWKGLTG